MDKVTKSLIQNNYLFLIFYGAAVGLGVLILQLWEKIELKF